MKIATAFASTLCFEVPIKKNLNRVAVYDGLILQSESSAVDDVELPAPEELFPGNTLRSGEFEPNDEREKILA
jgi:hypothetical protein